MYVLLVLACTATSFVFCANDLQKCDSTHCYQNINKTHLNLLDLIDSLNSTTSKTKIPKLYDLQDLKNKIKRVKNVENSLKKMKPTLDSHVKKLNETEKEVLSNQTVVDLMLEKLSNISFYNNSANSILDEAGKHLKNFERSLELGENASKTCQQAHTKYLEFKTLLDEIFKNYNNVSKKFDESRNKTNELNGEIANVFKETVKTKNDFEKLKLPVDFIEGYYLLKSYNNTINDLKNNTELLKELLKLSRDKWNDQVKKRSDKVEKDIEEREADVKQMNADLNKYEDAFNATDYFDPTVNNQSRSILNQIKRMLNEAENQFKQIDFSDEEKKLLQDNENDRKNLEEVARKRRIIKEYNLILDALPISEEQLKRIRKEIDDLKRTIELVEKWRWLRSELERLKINSNEILKINCSALTNTSLIT